MVYGLSMSPELWSISPQPVLLYPFSRTTILKSALVHTMQLLFLMLIINTPKCCCGHGPCERKLSLGEGERFLPAHMSLSVTLRVTSNIIIQINNKVREHQQSMTERN